MRRRLFYSCCFLLWWYLMRYESLSVKWHTQRTAQKLSKLGGNGCCGVNRTRQARQVGKGGNLQVFYRGSGVWCVRAGLHLAKIITASLFKWLEVCCLLNFIQSAAFVGGVSAHQWKPHLSGFVWFVSSVMTYGQFDHNELVLQLSDYRKR